MKYFRTYFILLMFFLQFSLTFASEDIIDISSLLPGGGQTFPLSGTFSWVTDFTSGQVTTYYWSRPDDIVGLRCNAASSALAIIHKILGVSTSATLDMSTINFDQLQVRIKVRGSPDPTYGSCTLWGIFQPQIYCAYWEVPGLPIKPGISPGFKYAVSYNTVDALTVNHTAITFGRISTWTWFSYRFNITAQDFFKIGYFGINYSAGRAGTTPPYPTELQIDQIKLEGIIFR